MAENVINIEKLRDLITRCKSLLEDTELSEDDTRVKLIDRLLKEVLGWDEEYIVRQPSVETKDSIKRPDYWYPKIPRVIVEAKKLSTDLESSNFDQQVLDYAYNRAVNIAILTNFRQFKAWYISSNGEISPFCNINLISDSLDNIETQLKWFQNDNLLSNRVEEEIKRRGIQTGEIDISNELTISINLVRERLNNYLKKEYQKEYSDEYREELTQGVINRLIFIKKIEAEGVEDKKLEPLIRIDSNDIYNKIREVFKFYRQRYDSDIFGKPNEESEVEKLNLKDNIIKEVLEVISHPSNKKLNYNFAAIDVDILGNMYENYLAYVQKRARLSGGKSHKKEQGIYYTPKSIVDYIVQSTLGSIIKDLPFKEVKDLKIIDPACGSGSFLISAISLLNDYYKKHIKDYKSYSPSEKLTLMKNNIYGVDIDEKATEIAKLSIYLKILSLSEQSEIVSYTDLLPELSSNIKVADSLMSDWNKLFPNIKFDVIVMNPPYIGEKGHKEQFRILKTGPLREFYEGKMDIFYFFIHLAIKLCKENGMIGFITTDYYPTATGATKLRTDIKNSTRIIQLVDFSELKVFKSALGQHNMITILTKNKNVNKPANAVIVSKNGIATDKNIMNILSGKDDKTEYKMVKQDELFEGNDNQIRIRGTFSGSNKGIQEILKKMLKDSKRLGGIGGICNVNQGIISGADKVTRVHISKYKLEAKLGQGIFVLSKNEVVKLNLSQKDSKILKPWFKNSDVSKWATRNETNEKIIYADKRKMNLEGNNIKKYLIQFIKVLNNSTSNSPYLHRPRDINFDGPKIVAPQRSKYNTFGYNRVPWYASADVYFITSKENNINLKYILGLLNSKLYYLWLYYEGKRKGSQLELYQVPLSNVPIRLADEKYQAEMIDLVNKAIQLKETLLNYDGKSILSKTTTQANLDSVEDDINNLVYRIFQLNEDQIKTIEETYKDLVN